MSILGNKKTNHKGWFFQDFLVGTRGFEPPTPDTPCHCDKSAVTLVNTGATACLTVYANSAFFAKSALYTSMSYG